MKKPRLIVIAGPTASGKTDLAVELALRINGEVISADSMQVYRGMDIGTAKVTAEEMRGVPHHLIDIIGPDEEWNVMEFCRRARRCAEAIRERGRVPIVAGGTGFYIHALVYDAEFEEETQPDIRPILEARPPEELYRELGRVWRRLPQGWRTLVLSSHTEFERTFGRPADKKRKLYNGMLKCDLFMYW